MAALIARALRGKGVRRFLSTAAATPQHPPSILDAAIILPMLGMGFYLHHTGYIHERKHRQHDDAKHGDPAPPPPVSAEDEASNDD